VLLADAAPNGSGLAIIGVIFLIFIAVCLGALLFIVRWFLRRRRDLGPPPAEPRPEAGHDVPTD
jgi:flagellar basal body-associated protein FliL